MYKGFNKMNKQGRQENMDSMPFVEKINRGGSKLKEKQTKDMSKTVTRNKGQW